MMNSNEFGGAPEKSWQGGKSGSPNQFQGHRQVNINIANFHSNGSNPHSANENTQSPPYNGYNNGFYQSQKQLNLKPSTNPQNITGMQHHQQLHQPLYEQHPQQKQYHQQSYYVYQNQPQGHTQQDIYINSVSGEQPPNMLRSNDRSGSSSFVGGQSYINKAPDDTHNEWKLNQNDRIPLVPGEVANGISTESTRILDGRPSNNKEMNQLKQIQVTYGNIQNNILKQQVDYDDILKNNLSVKSSSMVKTESLSNNEAILDSQQQGDKRKSTYEGSPTFNASPDFMRNVPTTNLQNQRRGVQPSLYNAQPSRSSQIQQSPIDIAHSGKSQTRAPSKVVSGHSSHVNTPYQESFVNTPSQNVPMGYYNAQSVPVRPPSQNYQYAKTPSSYTYPQNYPHVGDRRIPGSSNQNYASQKPVSVQYIPGSFPSQNFQAFSPQQQIAYQMQSQANSVQNGYPQQQHPQQQKPPQQQQQQQQPQQQQPQQQQQQPPPQQQQQPPQQQQQPPQPQQQQQPPQPPPPQQQQQPQPQPPQPPQQQQQQQPQQQPQQQKQQQQQQQQQQQPYQHQHLHQQLHQQQQLPLSEEVKRNLSNIAIVRFLKFSDLCTCRHEKPNLTYLKQVVADFFTQDAKINYSLILGNESRHYTISYALIPMIHCKFLLDVRMFEFNQKFLNASVLPDLSTIINTDNFSLKRVFKDGSYSHHFGSISCQMNKFLKIESLDVVIDYAVQGIEMNALESFCNEFTMQTKIQPTINQIKENFKCISDVTKFGLSEELLRLLQVSDVMTLSKPLVDFFVNSKAVSVVDALESFNKVNVAEYDKLKTATNNFAGLSNNQSRDKFQTVPLKRERSFHEPVESQASINQNLAIMPDSNYIINRGMPAPQVVNKTSNKKFKLQAPPMPKNKRVDHASATHHTNHFIDTNT